MSTAYRQYVHEERVWATVVTFDIRAERIDVVLAQEACAAAAQELHRIDGWLSPFRDDSAVTAIRSGELSPHDAPLPVREVIMGCQQARRITGGAFDPWRLEGGFDPCGYVKGWGADRAAAILTEHGFADVSVNAAGDVTCRGESAPGRGGWRIGIADPRDPRQVARSVLVTDSHLATSGRYEQGDHIVDPGNGSRPTRVDSATVLAADGGLADALATALVVTGPAGLTRLLREPVSAYVVSGGHAWSSGGELAVAC